jgi:voltage-gated potassium channel
MVSAVSGVGNITGGALVALFIAAALVTVFSIAVIAHITHNFYASSYYALEALFDTDAFNSGALVASLIPPFSSGFYILFTVSVLDGIAKAVIIGFVLATLIKALVSIDLTSRISLSFTKRLKGHVIVCGYSMLAETLCNELKRRGMQFVVIDNNREKVGLLEEMGYRAIHGDFTDERVLNEAMLSRSKAIVFATESDFSNLLGVVTAKHARDDAKIITRASEEVNIGKMKRGGARMCLVPELVAGQELGDNVMKL